MTRRWPCRSTSSCRCRPACRARRAWRTPAPTLGARGRARGDGLAQHHRAGRDDELSRRHRRRRQDAGRDRRHAAGRQDGRRPLCLARSRPPFHAYVAGGPADDHEGTRAEDAIARVRQGMRAMLRLGSAWYDVAAQIKAVTEQGLDPRNFILCTDDCHSGTLVNEGHMNRVVRHAIAQGLKPHHRDPDGDAQHRPAFRAGARARLDHAGPPRRPDPDLGPRGAADRDS